MNAYKVGKDSSGKYVNFKDKGAKKFLFIIDDDHNQVILNEEQANDICKYWLDVKKEHLYTK